MEKELSGFALLSALCDAFSPSGNERPVLEMIKAQVEKYCDETYFDKKGNLICRISPEKKTSKNALFCAVADECGFMIKDIDEQGHLQIAALGGLDTSLISGRKVTVGYGDKTVTGVACAKPIHSLSRDEARNPTPVDKLYIELGTDKKEETEKLVKIGDFGTFRSKAGSFGDGLFKAKALEYRAGCAALCEVIRSVDRKSIKENLYFAFTVLGATGMKLTGATTVANVIAPERAYIFDGIGSGDVYGAREEQLSCRIGDGVVVSVSDGRTIFAPALVRELEKKLTALSIPVQPNRTSAGGDIASEIQKSGAGTRVVSVRIPVRYPRTPSSVISKKDYESMLAAAKACL